MQSKMATSSASSSNSQKYLIKDKGGNLKDLDKGVGDLSTKKINPENIALINEILAKNIAKKEKAKAKDAAINEEIEKKNQKDLKKKPAKAPIQDPETGWISWNQVEDRQIATGELSVFFF